MAMIKCPECGQRISSMAGTCPHCGVGIKGHLRECPHCGEYMLDAQDECPECGQPVEPEVEENDVVTTQPGTQGESTDNSEKTSSNSTLIWVIIVLLVVFCSGGYWAYSQWNQKQIESREYEALLETSDPKFYQQFLEDYPNSEYCRDVRERMEELIELRNQWNKISATGDIVQMENFIDSHPGSPYVTVCRDIIDSLDWENAIRQNSEVAIENYIRKHPEGRYIDQASEHRNILARSKVSDADKALIRSNIEALLTHIASTQTSGIETLLGPDFEFNHKPVCTADDIIAWAKQRKESDVLGLHYQINGELRVEKKSDTDALLYQISFAMSETISRTDPTKQSEASYNVRIIMNADKKIIALAL